MKFIVMADRWERKRDAKRQRKEKIKERTVDEIKERYFSVSKAILEYRREYKHPIVEKPFNYE